MRGNVLYLFVVFMKIHNYKFNLLNLFINEGDGDILYFDRICRYKFE